MAEGDLPPREAMDFDVVVVGAGPAGLAAAIKLKQLAAAMGRETSVVVLEKGSEVGAHILSGAVIDPVGLASLIPDWKARGAPVETAVGEDRFYYLGPAGALRIPNLLMPPLMSNHGNYIVSLGNLCRWLGEQAGELGVEIYPGFAAAEVLYDEKGAVTGVATGDMGIGKSGEPTDRFTRGMELKGKYTIIAEGARGSLAKALVAKFALAEGRQPQKYGIGLKELWEVQPELHRPGLVQHTLGWPLDDGTGGGSFLYHYGANLVSVGFVVHLNYRNPYLSPFGEFQRFKTHPLIRETFAGGRRKVALRNLELCLPELDARQRRDIAREHFTLVGGSVLEYGITWYASRARLMRLIRVEGDATLAMTRYLAKHPMIALAFIRTSQETSSVQFKQAPRALQLSLLFPYMQGSQWAEQVYRRGGWEMISQAFTKLPQSTEQILHPEKYFSYEAPVKLGLPNLTRALGPGWKRIDSDVNGEWGYYLVLDEYLYAARNILRDANIELPQAG